MDDGQCEREGPVVSGGLLRVDLQNNLSHDPHGRSPDQSPSEEEESSRMRGGGGELFQQDSLNNNEDEDVDHVMLEEEEEGEESESSSVTRGQSPDTPMTDSSFSDTGSLVEFHASVSPETTHPISPLTTTLEELPQSDASHPGLLTCSAGPGICTLESTCTAGPITSTVGPITSAVGPITSIVEPSCTVGSISTITGLITSTVGSSCATGPITSTVGTSCTTGPIPTPALLACLQDLGERGDDTHLPQYLHQIAEAFVLQEDFERAVWCVQLERLYHQRLLANLSTLQEQWERHGRKSSNTDLETRETTQLERLAHICSTHQRPSTDAGKHAPADSLLKTPLCEEETADSTLTTCSSDWLAESLQGMEEVQRDSQDAQPIISATALTDTLCSNDYSARGGTETCHPLEATSGFHGDELIDRPPAECPEEPRSEMEQTTGEGGRGNSPEDKEMSRSDSEGVGEEVEEAEEAEEALEFNEEQEETDSSVPLKTHPQEGMVVELHPEAHLHHEAHLHQEAQLREGAQHTEQGGRPQVGLMGEERRTTTVGAASLDDLAKCITVEESAPAPGLVSILKRRSACVEDVSVASSSAPPTHKPPPKRRVRFKVPDDGYDQDMTGGDSCLLLFLLCLVTVVISVGGTALYCAMGDAHSPLCRDFARNADFYMEQVHRGMEHIRHWLAMGS